MNSSALGPPGQDLDSGHVVSGEAKSLPKDAQVITAILKEMGITEWEPRVVTQLLEFVYRYVTSVVEDAKLVSGHARKKTIDVEDIILAVEMYNEQHYSTPPPRDVLLDAARIRVRSSNCPLSVPLCLILFLEFESTAHSKNYLWTEATARQVLLDGLQLQAEVQEESGASSHRSVGHQS